MKNIIFTFLLTLGSIHAIEVGKVPKIVTISGKNGGVISGGEWSSSMLKGKIYSVFYVDPDERNTNSDFVKALNARNFDRSKCNSVAIINLAATWLPNIIMEKKLKEKQKRYPHMIYVKDKKKVLVKQWKLPDDSSNILVFDKNGKLLYKKFGKISKSEIPKVIALIEKHL